MFIESYAVELRHYTKDTKVVKISEAPIGSKIQLKTVDLEERQFDRYDVNEDCSLKEHFDKKFAGETYVRGCAFYEFLDKENISADQELIFMHIVCQCGPLFIGSVIVTYIFILQTTRTYFYPDVDQNTLYKHHLIGEELSPPSPSFKDYQVFVQSTGPGSRHLSKGSTVLYEVNHVLVHHVYDVYLIKLL